MKKSDLVEKIAALESRVAELEKTKRRKRLLKIAAAICVPFGLWAATVIPHGFADGETLSAEKLNANFQALAAKIDAMEGKSWRLIYETDVTSATTTISVTGLDGDVDREYRIHYLFTNGSGATTNILLRLNSDSSSSNYGWQRISGGGTTASANQNTASAGMDIGFMYSGTQAFGDALLLAKSGNRRYYLDHQIESANNTTIDTVDAKHGVWTNTASNITSMQFVSTQTNGIGAGSHIEIWARR